LKRAALDRPRSREGSRRIVREIKRWLTKLLLAARILASLGV
jgi:hypothetical protein